MIELLLAAALWEAGDTFEDSNGVQVSCENAQTQSALNQCAGLLYARADDALNVQWKLALQRVKELDADIDRKYDKQPGYVETLLKAQRAWIAYRDANCLLDSFEARGGTMAPMLEAQCLTHMTEARTEDLKEIVKGPVWSR